MRLSITKSKIAIILPYKEIYSNNYSGAVSIWVKDYMSKSILSDITDIYGSLEKDLKPITKNFNNLRVNNFLFSKTKNYISKFYKDYKKKNLI